jgi:hypothetical protein
LEWRKKKNALRKRNGPFPSNKIKEFYSETGLYCTGSNPIYFLEKKHYISYFGNSR